VSQAFPAPPFSHAAEAFVLAHAAPGAWSPGTAIKYRQTLTVLGRQPAGAHGSIVTGTPSHLVAPVMGGAAWRPAGAAGGW
jgi:hypothetical protein